MNSSKSKLHKIFSVAVCFCMVFTGIPSTWASFNPAATQTRATEYTQPVGQEDLAESEERTADTDQSITTVFLATTATILTRPEEDQGAKTKDENGALVLTASEKKMIAELEARLEKVINEVSARSQNLSLNALMSDIILMVEKAAADYSAEISKVVPDKKNSELPPILVQSVSSGEFSALAGQSESVPVSQEASSSSEVRSEIKLAEASSLSVVLNVAKMSAAGTTQSLADRIMRSSVVSNAASSFGPPQIKITVRIAGDTQEEEETPKVSNLPVSALRAEDSSVKGGEGPLGKLPVDTLTSPQNQDGVAGLAGMSRLMASLNYSILTQGEILSPEEKTETLMPQAEVEDYQPLGTEDMPVADPATQTAEETLGDKITKGGAFEFLITYLIKLIRSQPELTPALIDTAKIIEILYRWFNEFLDRFQERWGFLFDKLNLRNRESSPRNIESTSQDDPVEESPGPVLRMTTDEFLQGLAAEPAANPRDASDRALKFSVDAGLLEMVYAYMPERLNPWLRMLLMMNVKDHLTPEMLKQAVYIEEALEGLLERAKKLKEEGRDVVLLYQKGENRLVIRDSDFIRWGFRLPKSEGGTYTLVVLPEQNAAPANATISRTFISTT